MATDFFIFDQKKQILQVENISISKFVFFHMVKVSEYPDFKRLSKYWEYEINITDNLFLPEIRIFCQFGFKIFVPLVKSFKG